MERVELWGILDLEYVLTTTKRTYSTMHKSNLQYSNLAIYFTSRIISLSTSSSISLQIHSLQILPVRTNFSYFFHEILPVRTYFSFSVFHLLNSKCVIAIICGNNSEKNLFYHIIFTNVSSTFSANIIFDGNLVY